MTEPLSRTPLRPLASYDGSGSRGRRERQHSSELGASAEGTGPRTHATDESLWLRQPADVGVEPSIGRSIGRVAEASPCIRCDLKTRDAVYYATTAQAAERLRHECELRARSGFDAEWLGPAQLRRLTGIAGHGAIRSTGSAQFDPYRACVGIFRRAAAGAQVFERSEARRIERRTTVCASEPVKGRFTQSAWSLRPAMRRLSFGRWRDGFECIGRTFLRRSRSTGSNVTTSVCPTSWSGTPSGLTTMLAGHRSIDFSWAARTA